MSDIRTVTIRQEVEFVHDVDFSEFTEEERKAIDEVINLGFPDYVFKLGTGDVRHQVVAKLLRKIPFYPDDPIDFTLTEISYEEPDHE